MSVVKIKRHLIHVYSKRLLVPFKGICMCNDVVIEIIEFKSESMVKNNVVKYQSKQMLQHHY